MRPRPSAVLLAAAAALWSAAGFAADPQAAGPVQPHRALYEVSLAGSSAVVQNARGLAATEVQRTCEGWRYVQRYELEIQPVGGETGHTVFQMQGRESLDGRTYAFNSTTDYGEGDPVTLIGQAESGPDGGEVRYTEPAAYERPLPADVAFAIGSVARQIRAAQAGETQTRQNWFVGAVPDEPLLISSVILPAKPDPAADGLLAGDRWTFVSGFYADPAEPAPLYEGEETLVETGVLAGAVYRYDGYALRLKLQRVEPLPLPDC